MTYLETAERRIAEELNLPISEIHVINSFIIEASPWQLLKMKFYLCMVAAADQLAARRKEREGKL